MENTPEIPISSVLFVRQGMGSGKRLDPKSRTPLRRPNLETYNPASVEEIEDNLDNDDDKEIEELSRLRCPSSRIEENQDKDKRRKNRCADYPGLAFGSPMFGSDTMMKFNIIKNELHNIMKSQLKRVDGEVIAFTERIRELDVNLEKSERFITSASIALSEAVECNLNESASELASGSTLNQFDAQMILLEGKLKEAKFLAAQASM